MTKKDPSDVDLRYAMGWACPDSTGCVHPNSQFSSQIYYGGRQLVTHKLANFARQPGTHRIQYHPSPECGSTSVNVVNYATAALYNYTRTSPRQRRSPPGLTPCPRPRRATATATGTSGFTTRRGLVTPRSSCRAALARSNWV